jgi:hypothetical protein
MGLMAPLTAISGANFVRVAGYSTKQVVYARRCPSQKYFGDRQHCVNDKKAETAIPAYFVSRPEPIYFVLLGHRKM